MTQDEVRETLRGFARDFRIDPHDAGLVWQQTLDNGGVDRETLGDYLDGAGYPELAQAVYDGAA